MFDRVKYGILVGVSCIRFISCLLNFDAKVPSEYVNYKVIILIIM